jgi:hypothetical protein
MTPLVLKLCNVAAFGIDMGLNAGSGQNIKELAEVYDHIFMPPPAAFSIWGIIFAWELIFIVSQFLVADFDHVLPSLTPWFCLTQIMQGLWTPLFTKTEPSRAGHGGDAWLWISSVILVCTPAAFLQVINALSTTTGAVYWLSLGITINAAWVLFAAGLSINQAARAIGLQGTALSALTLMVLAWIVYLELWITGFIGEDKFSSPVAFFPVATWAFSWIFSNLGGFSTDTNAHVKRLLPLYGSNFVFFFKWTAFALAVGSMLLEFRLCTV